MKNFISWKTLIVNTSHHLFPLCVCSAAQLNLILCNSMDCILLQSSVHGISQGKNTEVGCHFLLQGIFPTQGLNHVSCLASRFFTIEPLGKPLNSSRTPLSLIPLTLSSIYPVYQLLGGIPQACACSASKLMRSPDINFPVTGSPPFPPRVKAAAKSCPPSVTNSEVSPHDLASDM